MSPLALHWDFAAYNKLVAKSAMRAILMRFCICNLSRTAAGIAVKMRSLRLLKAGVVSNASFGPASEASYRLKDRPSQFPASWKCSIPCPRG